MRVVLLPANLNPKPIRSRLGIITNHHGELAWLKDKHLGDIEKSGFRLNIPRYPMNFASSGSSWVQVYQHISALSFSICVCLKIPCLPVRVCESVRLFLFSIYRKGTTVKL